MPETNIQFPLDLIKHEAFTMLTHYTIDNNLIQQYSAARANSKKNRIQNKQIKKIENAIFLPIPIQGIGATDTHMFEDITGGRSLSNIIQSAVAGVTKETLGQLFQLNEGQAINERVGQMWQGVSLRNHALSWDLIPKEESEAINLRKIIKEIRRSSLPEYGSSNLIKYPSLWSLQYFVKGRSLYTYDTLMLSKFEINNDLEGQSVFFTDGMPVKNSLTLEFTEIRQNGKEQQDSYSGWNEEEISF